MEQPQQNKRAIVTIVLEVDDDSISEFMYQWDNLYTQYLIEHAAIVDAKMQLPESTIKLRKW